MPYCVVGLHSAACGDREKERAASGIGIGVTRHPRMGAVEEL